MAEKVRNSIATKRRTYFAWSFFKCFDKSLCRGSGINRGFFPFSQRSPEIKPKSKTNVSSFICRVFFKLFRNHENPERYFSNKVSPLR